MLRRVIRFLSDYFARTPFYGFPFLLTKIIFKELIYIYIYIYTQMKSKVKSKAIPVTGCGGL
jgi:hypothetical protein